MRSIRVHIRHRCRPSSRSVKGCWQCAPHAPQTRTVAVARRAAAASCPADAVVGTDSATE
ncbi:hypothetical protein [Streptomyces sp. URMC 129]|uniref:hypothetical protein n=1 Tax=Streptomyces sp. URMC 129 TaxID=3423407 RepID=UPI003F1AEC9F